MQRERIIKKQLAIINSYFRNRKERLNFQPNYANSKIDKNNTLTKNIMRLLNKTMLGINRIQTNRRQITYGLLGLLVGYLSNQVDDFATDFQQNYKHTINNALILHVFRNQEIKATLNQILLQNVYTNKDVQYNLHQVLYWRAIKPQQGQLATICKTQIIKALNDSKTKQSLSNLIAESIEANKNNISSLTVGFLGSGEMNGIICRQLSGLLKGQAFSRLLAERFISISSGELKKEQNRDSLYQFLRFKYMNF